ncbi:hypothetical protein N9M16_06135 [Candidatus Dependentiae bacterium]|nr:hypothetical protein [Candidatus Dependentiae bacterium]
MCEDEGRVMPRVLTRVDLDQATTMDGCEDASARYIPRVRATTRAMIGRPDPRGPIFLPPSPLSRPAFSSLVHRFPPCD